MILLVSSDIVSGELNYVLVLLLVERSKRPVNKQKAARRNLICTI